MTQGVPVPVLRRIEVYLFKRRFQDVKKNEFITRSGTMRTAEKRKKNVELQNDAPDIFFGKPKPSPE